MAQGLFFLVGRWALGGSGPIGCDVRCHLARAFSDRDLQEDPKWKISDSRSEVEADSASALLLSTMLLIVTVPTTIAISRSSGLGWR